VRFHGIGADERARSAVSAPAIDFAADLEIKIDRVAAGPCAGVDAEAAW
jgi:hypothetical protein